MRKQNKKKFRLFVSFWTLLRLVAVITLWIWHPLWGALFNIFVDAIDGHMFESFGVNRNTYEVYDKWLDLWFYITIAVFTFQKLQGSPYFLLLMILFFVRLAGIVLYAKFEKEWILFALPNLLEPIFLVVVGFPYWFVQFGEPLVLGTIFVSKMFLEWWIHLAKLDFTSIILGKPTRWYKKRFC